MNTNKKIMSLEFHMLIIRAWEEDYINFCTSEENNVEAEDQGDDLDGPCQLDHGNSFQRFCSYCPTRTANQEELLVVRTN